MLILFETGRRIGVRRRPKEAESRRGGLTAIEGMVFALFGLLIGFTLSGAVSRLDEKRILIAEEVNTIEIAYLRLHLLSPEAQPGLQELFRRYVDSRLETYSKLPDMEAAEIEIAKSKKIQQEIWTEVVAAARLPSSHPAADQLLLPTLNSMIDIMTTSTMALQIHPPRIVYTLLFGLALACSLLAGYQMASRQHRSWLCILGFTMITVIMVYVVLDIDYPGGGLIRRETADQQLFKVRESMK
jgi:hypothetical protein